MPGSHQSKAASQGRTRRKPRMMTVTLTDQSAVPQHLIGVSRVLLTGPCTIPDKAKPGTRSIQDTQPETKLQHGPGSIQEPEPAVPECSYSTAQGRNEEQGLSLDGAPWPVGRGCGWRSRARLDRAIKVYWCTQSPDR